MYFDPASYQFETSLGFAVHRVKSVLARRADERLAPLGLSTVQASALLACRKYSTAAEISRVTCNDAAALKRVLDKLEACGLVRRTASQTDRRQQTLSLTPAGEALADKIPALYCETLSEVFEPLSIEECGYLKSLLFRVAGNGVAGK